MTKNDQELIRRLKKMRRHTKALKELVGTERHLNIIDEIDGGINAIQDDWENERKGAFDLRVPEYGGPLS